MAFNNPDVPGVAIIAGAASGVRATVAGMVAPCSRDLVLLDLDRERLVHQGDDFAGGAGRIDLLSGDLADSDFPQHLVGILAGRKVAALVHCSGLSPTMGSPETILDVNLAATIRLVDRVEPLMACGGAVARSFRTNCRRRLRLSKRRVLLPARRRAKAFGRQGARITSLSSGIIDAPMGRRELRQQSAIQMMVGHSAPQRMAAADEVAAAAIFLCSSAASFITGTDILVDGDRA